MGRSVRDEIRRSALAACLAFVTVVAATACAAAQALTDDDGWEVDIPVLRIGLVTGLNPDRELKRREPFRGYLEQQLDTPVELIAFDDYLTLIDAHVTARVDYALYSSSAYAIASSLCGCIEPLAVPTDGGERIGYYAVLVASVDSSIDDISDLEDRLVLLGNEASVAGTLLPARALERSGVHPADMRHAAAMTDAVLALLDGATEAAAAWTSFAGPPETGYSAGTFAQLVRDGRLDMADIKIVWRSRLVPYGPHAIRKDLPPLLKLALIEALLGLPHDDFALVDAAAFPHTGPFRQVRPELFAPLMRSLGLEPHVQGAAISARAPGEEAADAQ